MDFDFKFLIKKNSKCLFNLTKSTSTKFFGHVMYLKKVLKCIILFSMGLKAGILKDNGYTKKTDPAFVQTRGSTHFTPPCTRSYISFTITILKTRISRLISMKDRYLDLNLWFLSRTRSAQNWSDTDVELRVKRVA